ncbi:zinc-binding dehydrogenase [Rubrobacter marinus]|uniref:Zinc-binding dehydrogenase n=2 Tax=Rubrobacter marinus TaxID=2653852 RepID=A0A6G8Q296_9ACTN|nr:zinc-binding dehydrogenase [Rubrobacter marinus]
MRALGFRRYGPPEVLEPTEVPKPRPADDGVLIRVAAAGVNPADWRLRSGQLRLAVRLKMPFVPGSDVAGVVEAVGPAVTRLRPGDAVYAMLPNTAGGGYAEYAAVAERDVARVPPGLSLAQAAGVPLAALTALQALRDRANLRSGDRVLVNGASGGVGTFAVQIAAAMGGRVTGAASGRNAELVRSLGAKEVLDYAREDVLAGGERYDAVFDAANVLSFRAVRKALRPDGVFVTVNPVIGKLSPRWLARLRGGRRMESILVRPGGEDLETVGRWISGGLVKPVIDRSYGLAEAAEAQRYSAEGRARGKILLVVDEGLAEESVSGESRRSVRWEGQGPRVESLWEEA